PTPSGRCELYSQTMAPAGHDPLPTYTPPNVSDEQLHDAEILHCISPPAHSFLNSTFVNVGKFASREKHPLLLLHPDDAQQRGIVDGMEVSVENHRGSVGLIACVRDEVVRGTVVAPSIWWTKLCPEGRNINWLSS